MRRGVVFRKGKLTAVAGAIVLAIMPSLADVYFFVGAKGASWQDGWWELVWSEWSRTVVERRGRVYLADGRFCPTECANGTKVWLCRHIDDTVSVVLNKPEHGVRPTILFSNNPRVRKT